MIIEVQNTDKQTEKYSFPASKTKIVIGRKPKAQDSDTEALPIDEVTASRTHL